MTQVSDGDGLAMMNVFNTHGVSSSLSKPPDDTGGWANNRRPAQVVPVVALSRVLAAVPANVSLWLLKTDMQGFDGSALASAGTRQ